MTISSDSEKTRDVGVENIPAPDLRIGYDISKRALDLLCSVPLAILLVLPMLVIAVMIRVDSVGPVIFRQERLGKGGKPFLIFKFRTMSMDAEADGPQWAQKEDARCTRLGRVLRRTHLDELPQIWNILIGNMSFVGPRPERAYFYDEFETYIPGFRNRLYVKPGLTGLAQINGGYNLGPEEKLAYDMEYINRRSLRIDLACMVKTIRLLFRDEDAR